MNVLTPESHNSLIQGMEARFNREELGLFCRDLDIDLDILPDDPKSSKIVALANYCIQQEIVERLIKVIRTKCPNFLWEPVFVARDGVRSEIASIKNDTHTSPIIHLNNNPLEACIPFIQQLVSSLKDVVDTMGSDNTKDDLFGRHILDCIVKLYSARSVFTVSLRDGDVSIPTRCSNPDEIDIDETIQLIRSLNASTASHGNRKSVTALISSIKAGSERLCLVSLVPLKDSSEYLTTADFLVIAGVPSSSVYLGDEFSVVLNAIYFATNKLSSILLPKIEEDILDDLKRYYFSLPNSLEKARLRLIETRLKQLTFHFQPIIRLHPKDIYISSWEALARDKNSLIDSAPKDLLASIELWGESFSAIFDSYVLRTAVETYRRKLRSVKGMRRSEDLKDLSVNVYPQSLAQPDYYHTVKHILADGMIPCEKLILELSERSTFPTHVHSSPDQTSTQKIRKLVETFVQDFQIDFSIDDFGSGQNQIDKLNLLPVKYLKVDRTILLEKHVQETLEFIIKATNKSSLVIPKVIVEGFEEGQQLTLSHLYKLGIRYVQCFLSGMPKDSPYRLDRETIYKLKHDILMG